MRAEEGGATRSRGRAIDVLRACHVEHTPRRRVCKVLRHPHCCSSVIADYRKDLVITPTAQYTSDAESKCLERSIAGLKKKFLFPVTMVAAAFSALRPRVVSVLNGAEANRALTVGRTPKFHPLILSQRCIHRSVSGLGPAFQGTPQISSRGFICSAVSRAVLAITQSISLYYCWARFSPLPQTDPTLSTLSSSRAGQTGDTHA